MKLLMDNDMLNNGTDMEALFANKQSARKVTTVQSAKLEIQKNNQQQYLLSKTQLSKLVAELEREKKDDEKKIETLKHKVDQT